MALQNAFGNLALESTASGIATKLASGISTTPSNIIGKFREAFEDFTPGVRWDLTAASGDIVQLDGNTAAASYLVISKDPLRASGETKLTTVEAFQLPLEIAVGLSMSQRTLGQELSMEVISTETPLTTPDEIVISSISQTTTTLTVTTASGHGLFPGKRIGIYGVGDSRFNYPSLVVATIPSDTQFTCTTGPGGTISSVTAGPYASGLVYHRSGLGYAPNGISEIFENATATNASIYVRANSGDLLPGGTVNANHSTTVNTTAGTQATNTPFAYAWQPSSEYRIIAQADRVQLLDTGIDSTGNQNNRILRTQVVPDFTKDYKLRFRFTNNKSLTVPTAKIVSVAKSGSTTATITTDIAHGLSIDDRIVIYGIRDQTNFANLTTATQVASIVSPTSFTVAFGASTTATSYGGMVSRVQGNNVPTGYNAIAIQSAANDGSRLTLAGNTTWTWSIGDYVNVYGCRDNSTGADLGVDGAYKVASIAATTLILIPIGSTVLPGSFVTINAGGTTIRRTDLRLSFARVFDYVRQRVEVQPNAALAASVPVTVNSGISLNTNSNIALSLPRITADVTSAAITSTTTVASITPNQGTAYQVNIPVTAVSGTSPTLDVTIQESDDSGTNWFNVYDFPRITATGMYRSPIMRLTGNRVRYVQTITGTSPSFTRAINRLEYSCNAESIRQLIDRTIVLTTLNSTTPSLDSRDCGNRVQLVLAVGAITTTAPALQLEGSDDNGASWYAIGSPLTAVASSVVQTTVVDLNSASIRARVSTAGVGVTANYVMIKAHD